MSKRKQRQKPAIVSIQSQLVYGCAGNNAAVPLMQRLGATVYAVPTVLLSNTPHYPTIGGGPLEADFVADLFDRLFERVEPADIDGIVTGYSGSERVVSETARFIDQVREGNSDVVVLCDPVMGDTDIGQFVPDDVAVAIRDKLAPRANILTPNLFEAQWLTGLDINDPRVLMETLLSGRASVASLTGIGLGDTDGKTVSTLAFDSKEIRVVTTPRLDARPTGTGDLFSAAFMYYRLVGCDLATTLSMAVEHVFSLMENLLENGLNEIDAAFNTDVTDRKTPRFIAEKIALEKLPDLLKN